MAHALTTHSARIVAPIRYLADGKRRTIPVGPCLLEAHEDDQTVDIIWGAAGEKSAALPLEKIEAAENNGDIVLLD